MWDADFFSVNEALGEVSKLLFVKTVCISDSSTTTCLSLLSGQLKLEDCDQGGVDHEQPSRSHSHQREAEPS